MSSQGLAETKRPLVGGTLFLGALALALCTFMQVLDYSIANVSIPYIAGDIAVSLNEGTWVITMFAVGNAIVLPLTGWLTKRFGTIKLMVMATALFTLLSVFCGLSRDIFVLTFMRFVQGVVGGPMIPLSQTLLIMTFPKEKKSLALALWTMVAIVGPLAGPILGGWITYNYEWPWIFFINVPVGIFSCLVIWQIYKKRETPTEKLRVDGVALLLLGVGIAALQIMLDQGQQYDWWRSNLIWFLAIIAFFGLVSFIIKTATSRCPLIDFKLFKNRNFVMGTGLIAMSYTILFGIIVISPLWLQTYMGYTPLVSGLAVSTVGIIPFCTVLLVAKLMNFVRLKYLVIFALLSFSAALFYYSTFNTDVTLGKVALSRFYLGIGICTYLAPITALTFSGIPNDKLPMGQGIFQFARIFMGGVGTSLSVTLWNRRANFHHSHLVDSVNPLNPISKSLFDKLREYRIVGKQALASVDDIAWKQAYMLSTNDLFYLCGWLYLGLVIYVLFMRKGKRMSFLVAPKEKAA